MNYTTLSSRVPNTQVTTSVGLPADIGLAPAIPGQIPENVSSDGTNDVAPPNPQGRDVIDADGTRPKFLSCRNRILISTFNTRTLLHPLSHLNELVLNAKAQKVDVISIQEHRFFHPDTKLEYHHIEDYQLITSSCWKNSVNASIGGVGLLLSPKAMENLSNIEKISSRIIIADFEGNPNQLSLHAIAPLTLVAMMTSMIFTTTSVLWSKMFQRTIFLLFQAILMLSLVPMMLNLLFILKPIVMGNFS